MKEATEICVILDRSGSMSNVQGKTIESFNTFIEEQKKVPGEATISLVQFDHMYEPVYYNKNLQEVELLTDTTYKPRGMTKLYDAIGKTIIDLGKKLEAKPESDRPNKVIVVILTDGQENDSKEFTNETIKKMIEAQTKVYSWEFLYLGANQDAIVEAGKMGINIHASVTYAANEVGTAAVFRSFSKRVVDTRQGEEVSPMGAYYQAALAEEEEKKGK